MDTIPAYIENVSAKHGTIQQIFFDPSRSCSHPKRTYYQQGAHNLDHDAILLRVTNDRLREMTRISADVASQQGKVQFVPNFKRAPNVIFVRTMYNTAHYARPIR